MRNPIVHPHSPWKEEQVPSVVLVFNSPREHIAPYLSERVLLSQVTLMSSPLSLTVLWHGNARQRPLWGEVRRGIYERNCSRAFFRCAPKTVSLPMCGRQNNTTGPLVKVKGAALELVCMWPVICFNPSCRKAGTLETPPFPTDRQKWIQISIGNVSGCFFSLISKYSAI